MTTVSLDAIRAAADARFGSLDIPLSDGRTVRLVNALQLPKHQRTALTDSQQRIGDDGADEIAVLEDALRFAANDDREGAEALIEEIGGNLAVLLEVFRQYNEGTQAGEASTSPS